MDTVKKLWPMPFTIGEKNVSSFVVQLIIFLVFCAVAGIVIGLLSALPLIGWLFAIVGGLVELYSTIGVVLCILKFLGMLK